MFTKLITDYGNDVNDLIKVGVDPSVAYKSIQKEMENSFKKGDFKLVPSVDPLVASLPEANQARATQLLTELKSVSANDENRRKEIIRELGKLDYDTEELENL